MDWLVERFQNAPDRIAFIHEDREVNYADVVATVSEFSTRIKSTGIKCSETVVLLGDYSPEVFCMMLALAIDGNIVIPLTTNSEGRDRNFLLADATPWAISRPETLALSVSHNSYYP